MLPNFPDQIPDVFVFVRTIHGFKYLCCTTGVNILLKVFKLFYFVELLCFIYLYARLNIDKWLHVYYYLTYKQCSDPSVLLQCVLCLYTQVIQGVYIFYLEKV